MKPTVTIVEENTQEGLKRMKAGKWYKHLYSDYLVMPYKFCGNRATYALAVNPEHNIVSTEWLIGHISSYKPFEGTVMITWETE